MKILNFTPENGLKVLCIVFTLKDPVIKSADKVQILYRAVFARACQVTKRALLSRKINSHKNEPDSFHVFHNGLHGLNRWRIKFFFSTF